MSESLATLPGAAENTLDDGDVAVPTARRRTLLVNGMRWVALLGLPASLASPGAVISMALVAAYGLGLVIREKRLDADLRDVNGSMMACYLLVVVVDFLNGGLWGNFATAFNYLPLLAVAPYAQALRRLDLSPRSMGLAMQATILVAAVMSVFRFVLLAEVRPGGLQVASVGYGVILSIWSMLLFSRALSRPGRSGAWLFGTVALAFVPILLAESKIGLATMLIGLVVVAAQWARESGRWRAVLAGAAAAALPLVVGAYLTIYTRLLALWDELAALARDGVARGSSFGLRQELNLAGWRAFLEAPWLGHGFDERMRVVLEHTSPDGPNVGFVPYVHNEYITHLVAMGVPGIVFVGLFLAAVVALSLRAREAVYRRAGVALTAMLAVYMLADVVFNMDPMISAVTIALGMIAAFGAPRTATPPPSRPPDLPEA